MKNGAVMINGALYTLYKPPSPAAAVAPEVTGDHASFDTSYRSVGIAESFGSPMRRSQAVALSPQRQGKSPFDALREYDMDRDREYYGQMLDRSIRLSPSRPRHGGPMSPGGAAWADASADDATSATVGQGDAGGVAPSGLGVGVAAAAPVVCAEAVQQAERTLHMLNAKAQRLLDALEVEAVDV